MEAYLLNGYVSYTISLMNKLTRDQQCPDCGRFSNRGVSIDAVIIKDGEVLLVQRGVEPNKGFWAIPGGYVEWDETTEQAVAREVMEETSLRVGQCALVGARSSPERHPKQVINLIYRVAVDHGDPRAGDDVTDVKWFPLDDLPHPLALDHKQNIEDALELA